MYKGALAVGYNHHGQLFLGSKAMKKFFVFLSSIFSLFLVATASATVFTIYNDTSSSKGDGIRASAQNVKIKTIGSDYANVAAVKLAAHSKYKEHVIINTSQKAEVDLSKAKRIEITSVGVAGMQEKVILVSNISSDTADCHLKVKGFRFVCD